LEALELFQVKRESVSTLLIESKIHVLAGDLPREGLSDSIKNDLALACLAKPSAYVPARFDDRGYAHCTRRAPFAFPPRTMTVSFAAR
jgi:hypothetical protein